MKDAVPPCVLYLREKGYDIRRDVDGWVLVSDRKKVRTPISVADLKDTARAYGWKP